MSYYWQGNVDCVLCQTAAVLIAVKLIGRYVLHYQFIAINI